MAALTKESLNKQIKLDLVVTLLVTLQSKMGSVNSDLVLELNKTRKVFHQIKSDLSVRKE